MSQQCSSIDLMELIKEKGKGGPITCAELFKISSELAVYPDLLGQCLTHSGIKISKCQLGLFGYNNPKKIVIPADSVPEELENKIFVNLEDNILPCAASWVIADEVGITKLEVAGACEKLNIKIKKCQLGAF